MIDLDVIYIEGGAVFPTPYYDVKALVAKTNVVYSRLTTPSCMIMYYVSQQVIE